MRKFIVEGLERGDLGRLVHVEVHIDEYKSKMGNDEDIVVLSFKIGGKHPALDLVNFIERGYSWIIDADVSSGEMDDGDYVVFVEMERTHDVAYNIRQLLKDLCNLTNNEAHEWRFSYHKSSKQYPATFKNLKNIIPNSPTQYVRMVTGDQESLDKIKTRETHGSNNNRKT